MSFIKSKGFKYLKNLIIGVGAAIVLVGALFKIQSWPFASEMLTIGLLVEAGLFLMLGLLGPEKDYYWEKLYPGLDEYGGRLDGAMGSSNLDLSKLDINTKGMESRMDNMIGELQTMARSMSSLKALQEVDFSGTKDQLKKVGDFYKNMNDAMEAIAASAEDTKKYKDQLAALNKNMGALNTVYGGVLNVMSGAGK